MKTHLNITSPLDTKFAKPIHSTCTGNGPFGCTIYFKTSTVMPPASPPAKNAKPKNNTTLAFHATPEPEYEKESADSRVFSIELMISMPNEEKISGSQSMNAIWISLPFISLLDHTAASRRA